MHAVIESAPTTWSLKSLQLGPALLRRRRTRKLAHRGPLCLGVRQSPYWLGIRLVVAAPNSPIDELGEKERASTHSRKRRCAKLEPQIPVPFNAFHCIPIRNTNEIASIALPSGSAAF